MICDAIEKYEKINFKYHPEGIMTRNKIISEAIAKKYDGIIAHDEIVVFEPNQIKSATENNGNFNPNSNNIFEGKTQMKKDIIKVLFFMDIDEETNFDETPEMVDKLVSVFEQYIYGKDVRIASSIRYNNGYISPDYIETYNDEDYITLDTFDDVMDLLGNIDEWLSVESHDDGITKCIELSTYKSKAVIVLGESELVTEGQVDRRFTKQGLMNTALQQLNDYDIRVILLFLDNGNVNWKWSKDKKLNFIKNKCFEYDITLGKLLNEAFIFYIDDGNIDYSSMSKEI